MAFGAKRGSARTRRKGAFSRQARQKAGPPSGRAHSGGKSEGGGHSAARLPPRPAAFLRHASSGRRGGSARRTGTSGAQPHFHHAALHASRPRRPYAHLRCFPPSGAGREGRRRKKGVRRTFSGCGRGGFTHCVRCEERINSLVFLLPGWCAHV